MLYFNNKGLKMPSYLCIEHTMLAIFGWLLNERGVQVVLEMEWMIILRSLKVIVFYEVCSI